MNGVDGWTERMVKWLDSWRDVRLDKWLDGLKDVWMARWLDEWVEG
jgi:hypothetical protein